MTDQKATNIHWHDHTVNREERQKLLGQKGALVWLTGLSGSGKSTIAQRAAEMLHDRGRLTYVLDGDNVRHGLNKDLGFTPEDRVENIRRIGEVGKLFVDGGVLTFTAFISPYQADRNTARALLQEGDFIEVHVAAPLEVCEGRDPKGLYKKARAGVIPNFTGISAPYEAPEKPELVIETGEESVDQSAARLVAFLEERGLVARA